MAMGTGEDPFDRSEPIIPVGPCRQFTDREEAIAAFLRYVDAPPGTPLKILNFWGESGIGKTALLHQLMDCLRKRPQPLPHALFSMESLTDHVQAYRDVLPRLRADLERQFSIAFPRFDQARSAWLAREDDGAPPMTGGTGDAPHLRARALQDDPTLPQDLLRRFAQDLAAGLPLAEGKAGRGVIFLDAYEALRAGREGAESAQGRRLDQWVRDLADCCLAGGVMLVIAGRERLRWDDNDGDASDRLEGYELGGLSDHDAHEFLARCGVGPHSPNRTLLQAAIIECCDVDRGANIRCHPFYLALCAEITLNARKARGESPSPQVFGDIPITEIARVLAERLLMSLHDRPMELWVSELSLTPRFDEQVALALDRERQHGLGRAGWERLLRFSFVEWQADGSFRLHRTMREALRGMVPPEEARAAHQWFLTHWQERGEPVREWFHRWALSPEAALGAWRAEHERAIKGRRFAAARALLTCWAEVPLDEAARRTIGDELWARAHGTLGVATFKTPMTPLGPALMAAIGHYETALRVRTEIDFPLDWARTQNNLGVAYRCLAIGPREGNLRKAIACYEAALRVYTEADYPAQWARTQNNLGVAYRSFPTGDQEENLRKAIACYEAALRVYTEADSPLDWAMTQNNLGLAYWDLPAGDRGESLSKAIIAHEAALRVYSEADFPLDWATTQNNLGLAYFGLPTGDRGENLRRAIAGYEASLRVRTETAFPLDWATTQNNLGLAYFGLPTGDRGENLRRAIAGYEASLRVRTETAFPLDWATTQNNLGLAYSDLPDGDRGENLRRAIAGYEASLRVYTEAGFPGEWATTQNNLGLAYSDLPDGDRGENLREAIACFGAALRVRTEAASPVEWAMTQNNLGIACSELPTGDRGDNLRKAVACYEAALRVYTEAVFPVEWATTQNNLGVAYSNLPDGDRGENLRRAIACFEAALRIYAKAGFSVQWAMTQNNLGIAYSNLSTGDRGANLRKAIACYEAASRVYTRAAFPLQWATTENNLGTAYSNLPGANRGENLRRAIACFEAALQVRTEVNFPVQWAITQNNLGIAYRNLATGNRAENLRKAIACYEAALRVRTEADFPVDWATTQNNLASALVDLAEITGAGDLLERAWICFVAAARRFRVTGMGQAAKEVDERAQGLSESQIRDS
jgi:tetratricopeptide (TPR) repeat protein